MIRLSAGYTKKLPVEGVDYSSEQYSAHVEIEVADPVSEEALRQRLEGLYQVLENTVDAKLGEGGEQRAVRSEPRRIPQQDAPATRPRSGNGNGHASDAQQRAIWAIAKDMDISASALKEIMLEHCGVSDPADLSRKAASSLIDLLKESGRRAPITR